MNATNGHQIRCHALRLKQSSNHPVYLFALTAAQMDLVGDVARLSRTDEGALAGYQRSIAKGHVKDIAAYLNSDDPLFPNGLILALPSSVKFEKRRGPGNDDGASIAGDLTIPLPSPGDPKPGWLVDGQQRWVALAETTNRDFPVPVAAFVADDIELQRDQFIRVNSVKPLNKALVTELLPEVSLPISPRLSAKKFPSTLVDLLNSHEDSPFRGLIKRPSTAPADRKVAVVQDTSLVKALEESLSTASGTLFPYRNMTTGDYDIEAIWWTIVTYWTAVREVFPEAWGLPPTKSRLMHGVGIRAMGRLMDRVMNSIDLDDDQAHEKAVASLRRIAPQCRWTSGEWEELNGLAWNSLENTPRHIRTLSSLLVRLHHQTARPSST